MSAQELLVRDINRGTAALPSSALERAYKTARAEGDRNRARVPYERWFAAKTREGDDPCALRRYAGTPTERFWASVIPGPDGHLYWDGRRDRQGRPITLGAGRWGSSVLAQRFAWSLRHGPVVNRHMVVSTCGEPHCLYVGHLALDTTSRYGRRFTDEQIVGALQTCAMQLGFGPRCPDYVRWAKGRVDVPSLEMVVARLGGSWDAALRAAGLTVRPVARPTRITDQQCFDALHAFVAENGHVPSGDEWTRLGMKPTRNTYYRRFGGWLKTLEAAGLLSVRKIERYERILELRADGFTTPQIAEHMGIAVNTVKDILNDPTGAKQWARRNPDMSAPTKKVRLSDVPLDQRLRGAWRACCKTNDPGERMAILAAALWPTDDEHRVAA